MGKVSRLMRSHLDGHHTLEQVNNEVFTIEAKSDREWIASSTCDAAMGPFEHWVSAIAGPLVCAAYVSMADDSIPNWEIMPRIWLLAQAAQADSTSDNDRHNIKHLMPETIDDDLIRSFWNIGRNLANEEHHNTLFEIDYRIRHEGKAIVPLTTLLKLMATSVERDKQPV